MTLFISPPSNTVHRAWKHLRKHLNFYRIHILCFTFIPLIFSGVFYASNGEYKISYIDSLFNCFSAMTVCGLATVDLSSLTPWQQVILFLQMCMGSPVLVSWIMVFIRKEYIKINCKHTIVQNISKNRGVDVHEVHVERMKKKGFQRFLNFRPFHRSDANAVVDEEHVEKRRGGKSGIIRKLHPDMIRRMDDEPRLINPSGLVSEKAQGVQMVPSHPSENLSSPLSERPSASASDDERSRDLRSQGIQSYAHPSSNQPAGTTRGGSHLHDPSVGLPRTVTVEFADLPKPRQRRLSEAIPEDKPYRSTMYEQPYSVYGAHPTQPLATHASLTTQTTHHTHTDRTMRSYQTRTLRHSRKNRGFGGFPMPFDIIETLFRKLFPSMQRRLTRTLTVPATTSLVPTPTGQPSAKHAPYVTNAVTVGRNSQFLQLTRAQMHQLGGEEYKALGLLLWVVAFYHIGIQIISFVIIAPYMSMARWKGAFVPPQLVRRVNVVWFSAFQVVSSYTNTGMSLVDQSMLPFQKAYPTILIMAFLILAGGTSFPIFLRFTLWCMCKVTSKSKTLHTTLRFLLDHPRRCFFYLFPSHQTWFLVTIAVILTFTNWIFFLILDLGNPAISSIPTNVRVLAGFFQAIAVRAAGFSIVPLAALEPAVKVLYTIMMYISVYPIAMSVRSTNVYEEKSLGVFPDDDEQPEDEENFNQSGSRVTVWSRYLAMHARQQLAFDMWWLAAALFLVCIIERGNLNNPENFGWFNIFSIIFELVSAYGTVGLSLGIPNQNYSLSGAFHPLSKLIVCLVMLRGRHRGLPVAIDRAVMVPKEYQDHDNEFPANEPSREEPWGELEDDHEDDQRNMVDNSPEPHRRICRKPIVGAEPERHGSDEEIHN